MLFCLGRYVSRQNKNGQIVVVWNSGTQLSEERVPVHMRHHEIEQNQIGLIKREEFKHLARVVGLTEVRVSALLQDAFEQENVCGLIVYDENPAFLDDFLLYHSGPCNGTEAGQLPRGNPALGLEHRELAVTAPEGVFSHFGVECNPTYVVGRCPQLGGRLTMFVGRRRRQKLSNFQAT